MPLAETLLEATERLSHATAGVVFVGRRARETRLGYARLAARAREAAGKLARAGVGQGERVGIVARTAPEFYDALLGAWLLGAVPVPLRPPYRLGGAEDYERSTSRMLRSAGCKVLVADKMFAAPLEPLARMAGLSMPPVVLETARGGPVPTGAAAPDHPALIQFSSGTTGDPKGAVLTHRHILANIAAIHALVREAAPNGGGFRDVGVCWLPLYHDMGLIGCVISALVQRAELVLIPSEVFLAKPAIWLRAISDHGGTVSPAPNFAFAFCAERISDRDLEGVDLSGWALALNGAEPVTRDAMSAFLRRFGKFGFCADALTPVYGLSEATLLVTARRGAGAGEPVLFDRRCLEEHGLARPALPGAPQPLALCSLGRPVRGTRVEIRDAGGARLPSGALGAIFVRGPSVIEGYAGGSDSPTDARGWLRTGDVGFVHNDELFVFSRADDMLVIRGRNLAPECFEHAAAVTPGTGPGRIAAIGIGDAASGTDKLVLLVERSSRSGPSDVAVAAETGRRVLESTGIRPAEVRVLPRGALPRTSSGKVRRREARRRFIAELYGAAEREAMPPPAEKVTM